MKNENMEYIKKATKEGNLEVLKFFMKTYDSKKVNINELLLNAIKSKQQDIVSYLITECNADMIDNDIPVISVAVRSSDADMVELLLNHGANVDEKDIWGNNALSTAVAENKKEIVELLLNHVSHGSPHVSHGSPHGADPNIENCNGDTPLVHAINNFHVDITLMLLEHGAYIDKALFKFREIEKRNENLIIEFVKMLIKKGMNINFVGKRCKRSLLGSSIRFAPLCVVHTLLEFENINVNVVDSFGNTPLIDACELKKWDIASALIDMGADVNVVNDIHNETALHHVCGKNKEIVKKLLEKGANPDVVSSTLKKSPIQLCFHKNNRSHWGHIKILLEAGSKSFSNENIITAIEYAPDHEIVRLMHHANNIN